MFKTKKFGTLAVIFLLAIVLVACGGQANPTNSSTPPARQGSTVPSNNANNKPTPTPAAAKGATTQSGLNPCNVLNETDAAGLLGKDVILSRSEKAGALITCRHSTGYPITIELSIWETLKDSKGKVSVDPLKVFDERTKDKRSKPIDNIGEKALWIATGNNGDHKTMMILKNNTVFEIDVFGLSADPQIEPKTEQLARQVMRRM